MYTAKRIEFVAPADAGALAGKTLTGGLPGPRKGADGETVPCVAFAPIKVGGKSVRPILRYDTRPELAALVTQWEQATAAEQAQREAEYAVLQEQERQAEAPLLAAMREEADALAARIPTDCVRVEAIEAGNADGQKYYALRVGDFDISWQEATQVGTASATRPGALCPFAEEPVYYIPRARLAELQSEANAKAQAKAAAKAEKAQQRTAAFAEAKATGQAVALSSWMEECDDDNEECSLDNVTLYALPGGTTETRRQHTW